MKRYLIILVRLMAALAISVIAPSLWVETKDVAEVGDCINTELKSVPETAKGVPNLAGIII